jgi:hypothetical protein
MADTIEINYLTYSEIKDQFPHYNAISRFNKYYKKGMNPFLLKYTFDLDTVASGADSLEDLNPPDNDPTDFTNGQQCYLVSDNAGDTDKDVTIIGQKTGGSFGQYTETTDSSDGTTDVDIGEWDTILTAWTTDTLAGTITINDDAAGTTTYFTVKSQGAERQAQLYVPTDHYGAILAIQGGITDVPGTVGSDADFFKFDDETHFMINYYQPNYSKLDYIGPVTDEETKVDLKGKFNNAAVNAEIELTFICWDK